MARRAAVFETPITPRRTAMVHPAPSSGIDPRRIITPESFSVAPHLLGLPLASPSRRFAAIVIDLILVAVLANVGGKVLFAMAVGASFFWFAGRKLGKGGTFFSRSARVALRGFGALMLCIAAAALWRSAQDRVEEVVDGDGGDAPVRASVTGETRPASPPATMQSGLAAVRMARRLVEVQNAPDSAHAAEAARAAVVQMRRLGLSNADIRQMLRDEAFKNSQKPWVAAAYRAAMPAEAENEEEESVSPDSLASLYLGAVRAGDTEAADALRAKLASTLARDSLDQLRGELSGVERERREIADKLEREQKKGILATLLGFLNDLGIGFGWIGLYFTAFTALWKGQTPGKKLLGIRVLRLDGLPMTLWASFERFGGYAAGLFTGLMGYAQVYWDRNRQAIQDKISETVVIRVLPGMPVPAAAPSPYPSGYPLPPRPSPALGRQYPPSPPPSPPTGGTGLPNPRG